MTFEERMYDVAKDFLQTVVVFDDLAYLGQLASTEPPEQSSNEESGPEEESPSVEPAQVGKLETPAGGGKAVLEVGVDVRTLTDCFAKAGLNCSTFLPQDSDDGSQEELLLAASLRADIVVLDWVIDRDAGDLTKRIIAEFSKQDSTVEHKRLRLIAVYTSQANLNGIVDEVVKTLAESSGSEVRPDDFVVTCGNTRVVILAKKESRVTGDGLAQVTTERDLPERLIAEFARFTSGLVPSVVLGGLAATRRDTHRILGVLGSGLDPAYVGERVLTQDADSAEDKLVSVLASELLSSMQDRDVGQLAGGEVVADWCRDRLSAKGLSGWSGQDDSEAEKQIEHLLTEGTSGEGVMIDQCRNQLKFNGSSKHARMSQIFAPTTKAGDESNAYLAMRVALRTFYSKPSRTLTLGTIVQGPDGPLLCVQPVCDAVRLKEARYFPFLPMEVDEKAFHIAVVRGESIETLRYGFKPFDLVRHSFSPVQKTERVIALKPGSSWEFEDVEGQKFEWLAQMHTEFALRVVHKLANEFSRVGLSETEWLRKGSENATKA